MTEKVSASVQQGDQMIAEYLQTRDQDLKEKIIKNYLALVKYIIGRIKVPETILLKRKDLNQFGIIGLLDAIERYDPQKGVSFKTFAYKRVYGEILDALRKYGVFSRKEIQDINKVRQATDELRVMLGREPVIQEVCKEASVSLQDYYRIQNLMNLGFTLSIDDKVDGDEQGDGLTRKEVIADKDQETPDVAFQKDSIKQRLKLYIKSLPERERIILALYYYEELTLNDIGQVLGISESRVSQIMNETLKTLRKKLADN